MDPTIKFYVNSHETFSDEVTGEYIMANIGGNWHRVPLKNYPNLVLGIRLAQRNNEMRNGLVSSGIWKEVLLDDVTIV